MMALSLITTLTSCEEESDFHQDPTPEILVTHADTVAAMASYKTVLTHEAGKGFPIVIMADGYTATDISNGTYAKAVNKAVEALFSKEPMASLKPYIDIYSVEAASRKSGVSAKKSDTAFRTYFPDIAESTQINGDSMTVMQCADKALQKLAGMTTTDSYRHLRNKGMVIVLLNSSTYAGVTYFFNANMVQAEGRPLGTAISYIPVNATLNVAGKYGYKGDAFPMLIQHEAVGHGIGKLADEYYYTDILTHPEYLAPTESEAKGFLNFFEGGYFRNVHYDPAAMGDHHVEEAEWIYPFTQDAHYAGEKLAWYTGAYVFMTKFYRPTFYSIMNATTDTRNSEFNVPSRATIYQNIMSVAVSDWKWNYDDFAAFDRLANIPSASAKGSVTPEEDRQTPMAGGRQLAHPIY